MKTNFLKYISASVIVLGVSNVYTVDYKTMFDATTENLGNTVKAVEHTVYNAYNATMTTLGSGATWIKDSAGSVYNKTYTVLGDLPTAVKDIAGKVYEAAGNYATWAKEVMGSAYNTTTTTFESAYNTTASGLGDFATVVGDKWEAGTLLQKVGMASVSVAAVSAVAISAYMLYNCYKNNTKRHRFMESQII